MAFENDILAISYPAAADLSSSQHFVVVLSSGEAALSGTAAIPLGVLQNKPESGQTASVRVEGISRAVAGAAIAEGAAVASDANGKLRTAVSGDYPVGQALEAAAADGDVIAVSLKISMVPLA